MTIVVIASWFALAVCILALLVACFQLLPRLRDYDEDEFTRAGYLGSFLPGFAIRTQARFLSYVLKKEYSRIEDEDIVQRFKMIRALVIASLALSLLFLVLCFVIWS
jgi:hypothetical protein